MERWEAVSVGFSAATPSLFVPLLLELLELFDGVDVPPVRPLSRSPSPQKVIARAISPSDIKDFID